MIKVLLLTDFSSGYSRNLLKGVVRYAKEFGPWTFYRMPLYYREVHGDDGVVRWAKRWGADAIIAQLTDVNVDALNEAGIPIIVQNYKERNTCVANLTGDYFGTGMMAADFFLRKGYTRFAYYGYPDTIWMRERGEGFRKKVQDTGRPIYMFNEDAYRNPDEKWSFDANAVSNWLLNLPKPMALFACDDYFALQIVEACKMNDIDIPGEIAVLGVDNDDLLCNISDPTLSSIELDVENGGYEAGRILHQFIEKKISSLSDVVINPIRVVTRKSTERYAVSDKYIEQILSYIGENYASALSVEDLIRLVPFSRRVLEKRFKDETGSTLYQYIQQTRIEKFAELLVSTDLSLVEAASQAGFDDYKNISRVFIKMKQMTPSQYRKKFCLKQSGT